MANLSFFFDDPKRKTCEYGIICLYLRRNTMMEFAEQKNVGFHSLQLEPYKNEELIESTSVFRNYGFKLGNAERYQEVISNPEHEFNVLNSKPDVTLYSSGDTNDSVIGNGMAFLNANNGGVTHIYTALSPKTTKEKLDKLRNEIDCHFDRLSNGTYFGYITVKTDDVGTNELNLAPFEMALGKLKNLELDTVKYPTSPYAISMLPQFTDKKISYLRANPEEVADVLQRDFKYFTEVFKPHNEEMADVFDTKISNKNNKPTPNSGLRHRH
tara:strand:+ start:6511 stop:7320 length:810 start_codon:yes stop_codon:yes gene_type:complete